MKGNQMHAETKLKLKLALLRKFLVEAKINTYASGEAVEKIIEQDGSTTLVYKKNNITYKDNYFGGEPFGGKEVVLVNNKPIYLMTYFGKVFDDVKDVELVYRILQHALRSIPEEKPFRGPERLIIEGYEYVNISEGGIKYFSGEESIYSPDHKLVYEANYSGGLICLRK